MVMRAGRGEPGPTTPRRPLPDVRFDSRFPESQGRTETTDSLHSTTASLNSRTRAPVHLSMGGGKKVTHVALTWSVSYCETEDLPGRHGIDDAMPVSLQRQ